MTGPSSSLTEARAEGHAALDAGKWPTANPYPWSDPRCKAWIDGYATARTELWDSQAGIQKYSADQPRDAQGRWIPEGGGKDKGSGNGHGGASSGASGSGGGGNTVDVGGEKVKIITEAEARGNSRPVSREEFQSVAAQGKAIMDNMRANASAPTGLTANLDAIKASTFAAVQEEWGGATINAHTGQALASNADKFAVTVKPVGASSVSVPEGATRAEWNAAIDKAMSRFGSTLANQDHYLGVFHDNALGRIDIDPVVVVDTQAQSEAIGAYTHNIGGAYNFRDGNGYWPPHVSASVKKGHRMADEVKTHFVGIGEWYAQNRDLNHEVDEEGDDE